jgi:hypothetical protein
MRRIAWPVRFASTARSPLSSRHRPRRHAARSHAVDGDPVLPLLWGIVGSAAASTPDYLQVMPESAMSDTPLNHACHLAFGRPFRCLHLTSNSFPTVDRHPPRVKRSRTIDVGNVAHGASTTHATRYRPSSRAHRPTRAGEPGLPQPSPRSWGVAMSASTVHYTVLAESDACLAERPDTLARPSGAGCRRRGSEGAAGIRSGARWDGLSTPIATRGPAASGRRPAAWSPRHP